jgi:phosphoribosylglycinamide formyltransferase-1
MKVKKIALFASGSGTNVQNIIEYFSGNEQVIVDSVWSNNPAAFALERAKRFDIEAFVFTKDEFVTTNKVADELKKRGIDLVVLAGFLWLIPVNLIQNFTIVNIHPALLPKYGGRGMYGMKVHQTVVDNREKESGITIHYVNEKYDEGKIIFQAKCEVLSTDCANDVALKVHELEYRYFPEIIEKVLLGEN